MHTLPHPVKYKNWTCRITISHYTSHPDRKAIVGNDWEDGMPIAAFTVNLTGDNTQEDEVAIDVNNCGQEAVTALMEAEIIGPKIRDAVSGFCTYPVHKLLV